MHKTDATHDPNRTSWVESANDPATDFPIQNLPLGVFCRKDEDEEEASVGIAIGDQVLDVALLAREGLLEDLEDEDEEIEGALDSPDLSALFCAGPEIRQMLRERICELLTAGNDEINGKKKLRKAALLPMSGVRMLLPAQIGDYTDFYASIHHATNVGSMFRPDNPLLPNYKWIPIGYHGRASTIVVSGTPIRRPNGQIQAEDDTPPVYAPSQRLDYEMEVGFFVGLGNELGVACSVDAAEEDIAGLVLVNDWSARDIQKWEYQPLGPFLSKSFATTVSPWVVTMEALRPFRCPAYTRPAGDPRPLPHLDSEQNEHSGGVDLTVEVYLASAAMREQGTAPVRLSRGSMREMYWTIAQMLAHHTSNGCEMMPGDLIATGTVSGPNRDNRGCLLELTWDGPGQPATARTPIELPTGEKRVFLADGDEIIMRGYCQRDGYRRIGFGECRGFIIPAEKLS